VRILILTVLVLLGGCVTKQEHEATLNSWLGASETSLVESWGPPTGFYEIDDTRYLTWGQSSQAMVGGTPATYTQDYFGNVYTTPGTAPILVTNTCDVTMVIKDGTVNSWQYEGNNCYDF